MMMNSHPHGEQISAYIDGMLDVGQTRIVAFHLAACPQCRASQEGLRQTKHLLAAIDSPAQPGPEFWSSAYRRMRVETAEKQRVVPNLSWGRMRDALREPQRRWSAGLAAAAIVAGAVVAPLMSDQGPGLSLKASVSVPTVIPDSVDVSTLMQAHTESAAREPFADTDRQDVIALDNSFSADDPGSTSADAVDAASDATP